jgi:NAD+ synthase
MMINEIVPWIRKRVQAAGAKGCVFGLSGGLDSSVVGILCKKAFPENVLGLLMPCFSQEEDLRDAQELAEKFSIPTKLIDLEPAYNQLYVQLEGKAYDPKEMNPAVANLKPRLRMITIYYHANQLNYLVMGTGNRSELEMGYFTKYGDGGADLLPLGGLLKTEVKKLAAELGIPRKIIEKVPTAGLWAGQTDEGEMGITYAELDRILSGKIEGVAKDKVELVKQKGISSRHKRQLPEIFKGGKK